MCSTPITIKNPNYGNKSKFAFLSNTWSKYIQVPCGHCPECISRKQTDLVQRILMESMKNHLYFASLTYNDDMLPRLEVNGHLIRYADYRDLNSVIRRIRRDNLFPRSFRYFAVSELGSKKGRPHFHVLFLVPKHSDDDYNTCIGLEKVMYDSLLSCWCRNLGSRSHPVYVPLCTYVRRYSRGRLRSNYDLHYVNPNYSSEGVADVGFYVMKYMLKPSDRAVRLQQALKLNLDESEYDRIWKIVKPRYFKSLGFGSPDDDEVSSYLRSGIDQYKRFYPYPVFVNPVNGKTFPLARYYKSKGSIFDVNTATFFALEYDFIPDSSYDSGDICKDKSDRVRLSKIADVDLFDDEILTS